MAREKHPAAKFQILGPTDAGKRGVPAADLAKWESEGIVELLGTAPDVRPFIEAADCVVLPSYREGMPRVLLEAGAMGRPVIAADVPGCRQIVRHGETGFLAEARSGKVLANKMIEMIGLKPSERARMGQRAREIVENEFSDELVDRAYLKALASIGAAGGVAHARS